jgi:hypothetical protein
MKAFTFVKYGQFMFRGKIYNWMFNGDTETMLVKNAGDEVLLYKVPFPKYKHEVTSAFIIEHLARHLDKGSSLTYEPLP